MLLICTSIYQYRMSFDKEIKRILLELPQSINEESIIEVYRYQYTNNPIYKLFADSVHRSPAVVKNAGEIPFLPIAFYKKHQIETQDGNVDFSKAISFSSSGTTSSSRSTHTVADPAFYAARSKQIFENYYGPLTDTIILAVLPSYEENPSSSLIFMMKHFIEATGHAASGFYAFNIAAIKAVLKELHTENKKIIVWGVSYALLDWAEQERESFSSVIFLETGGMKGRRKELTRSELHEQLTKGFGVTAIHSEYGMTELLSQAYSFGEGLYAFPTGLIPVLREVNDPFGRITRGSGGINIIDLANINACCFIETQDIGRISANGFEILGRIDASDIRGCNLLYV
ncbi:conserved hypothetical protein [Cytophaga hutchinsonii ATCC 33406]|uniref:Acyl transferase n=2 Tax=Cytophaga hutchinsonii TaxID=985 RepID=A0A6N4SS78_CYTH3|nr:conserved hypothetical protein [Cytophaga hutchinsonii ATCC 33406]